MVKPSRSDPEEEEQGKREWQQQSKLQEILASARPCSYKPSRSEPDDEHVALAPAERQMRRNHEFQSLSQQLETGFVPGFVEVTEEDYNYASDYYAGMHKEHHHATGTGLIDVGEAASFHYLSRPVVAAPQAPVKGRSNPAMNDDWAPQPHSAASLLSSKPSRSEPTVDFD